ncbi:MAG: LUD domain-containing protein [Dehalococcoidia bacterium]
MRSPSIDHEPSLIARFAAKAGELGASVDWATPDTLQRQVPPDTVVVGSARGLLVGAARPAAKIASFPDVVALGEFGVAETGSVLLAEDTHDRATCLLAERLWLLLRKEQIVASLDEALEDAKTLIAAGTRHLTFVSGPSRTGDIERVLTMGAHGPRELRIVLLEGRE